MRKLLSVSVLLAIVASLGIAGSVMAAPSTVKVGALQPTWNLGVFSAYVGPPLYGYVSPGVTAVYMGREAGIIKAGLTIDPTDGIYEDEGLFAFKPAVTIDKFATLPLTYDVVNQYGTNPVWMTIEIDTGLLGDRSDNTTFQMVPASSATGWTTVDAANGTWFKWNNGSGDITGNPPMTLAAIAADSLYTGLPVVRTYLRLGMGDSYGIPTSTVAWVDKASIGGVTYDFVIKGSGYAQKDWSTNPGNHGFKTP